MPIPIIIYLLHHPPNMADIQVKLLTLLNVSAVKRPGETDLPGAHTKFPVRSKTRFALASASTSASASVEPTSSTETGPGEATSEPPRKKKKTVQWNGEIGPSGSKRAVNGKTMTGTAAAVKNDDGRLEVEAEAFSAPMVADDVDEDDEGAAGSSAQGECRDLSSRGDVLIFHILPTAPDTFTEHFGITPAVLSSEAVQAADDGAWEAVRPREVAGLGRVVESRPKVKSQASAVEGLEAVNRVRNSILTLTCGADQRLVIRSHPLSSRNSPRCSQTLPPRSAPPCPSSANTLTCLRTGWMATATGPAPAALARRPRRCAARSGCTS